MVAGQIGCPLVVTGKEVVGGGHVGTNAGLSEIVSELLIKSEVKVDCGTPTDRAQCTRWLADRAENVQPDYTTRGALSTQQNLSVCQPCMLFMPPRP